MASGIDRLVSLERRLLDSRACSCSMRSAIRAIVATASTAYSPTAVSLESITASVPSKIAFATSDTSARVGRGIVHHTV
jgi:hypothetical protein